MAAAAGPPNDGDLDLVDWGRHLRADYRHDGLNPTTPYNIGGVGATYPIGGAASAEDAFMKYALNLPYISVNSMFKARLAGRVEFTLAEKTATYDGTAPQLFDAGNDVIGVVMDAGKYLTDYLRAQNAISFGMCIDPAGSSIKPPSRPVYFDPREKRVYIQLAQFGFDPEILQGIWIVDSGGSSLVKSIWVLGDGEMVDPVRRRKLGKVVGPAHLPAAIANVRIEELGGKPINEVDPDVAGYYTSIANATDSRGGNADYYKMGKTLGDTMIVASAMPEFKLHIGGQVSTTPNPYYGAGAEIGRGFGQADVWKNHFNQNNEYPYDTAPQSIMVKTGDQLNAVRAIFKGVPVILERQSKGGKPKFFEFYPGNPSPEQVITAIRTGYERLMIECTRRFTALITSFDKALERNKATGAPTGRIAYDYTKFVSEEGGRLRFPNDPAKLAAAGALIREIITPSLVLLRDACLAHITARSREIAALPGMAPGVDPSTVTMEQLEAIKEMYTNHTQEMLQISPQTTEIIEERVVKPIIYVSRIEDAGVGAIKNTEIHLLAAISGIADGTNSGNALILDQFVNRIPAAPATPVAPAEVQSALTYLRLRLWEVVQSVFGAIRGAMVGGARVTAMSGPVPDSTGEATQYRDVTSDIAPLTVALSEYIATHEDINPLARLTMIYNVLRMKDSPRIVDHVVQGHIDREFVILKRLRIIDFPTVAACAPCGTGLVEIPALPYDTPTTRGSQLFNAFVMRVNGNNSEIGLRGEGSAPRNTLFDDLERMFLEGPTAAPEDPEVLALFNAEQARARAAAAPVAAPVVAAPVAAGPVAMDLGDGGAAGPPPGGDAPALPPPAPALPPPAPAGAAAAGAAAAGFGPAERIKRPAPPTPGGVPPGGAAVPGLGPVVKRPADVGAVAPAAVPLAPGVPVPRLPVPGAAGGKRRTFRQKRRSKKNKNAGRSA
jgi:hypothetical protein